MKHSNLPIGHYYVFNLENISETNKKDNIREVVEIIINDIIDNLENKHNFEYISRNEIPKKKSLLKKILNYIIRNAS